MEEWEVGHYIGVSRRLVYMLGEGGQEYCTVGAGYSYFGTLLRMVRLVQSRCTDPDRISRSLMTRKAIKQPRIQASDPIVAVHRGST